MQVGQHRLDDKSATEREREREREREMILISDCPLPYWVGKRSTAISVLSLSLSSLRLISMTHPVLGWEAEYRHQCSRVKTPK